ncbi:MAG: pilin [Lysobacter sp.]|nr:pilin [Lysobacter sp.]
MSTPPHIPPAPPPAMPQPSPKKMSGCAIAAIIGAVVGVFGIVVLGILAAIAVPAYQQYLTRSQITQAYFSASQWQFQIDEFLEENQACPDNAALGLAPDESLPLGSEGGRRADVRLGETAPGVCAITLTFRGVPAKVEGSTLILESDDGEWTCSGGTLPFDHRPAACRTGLSATP